MRHLSKSLAEVAVEGPWDTGESRYRSIVSHRPHRLLAVTGHGRNHQLEIFAGEAKQRLDRLAHGHFQRRRSGLYSDQMCCLFGYMSQQMLLHSVVIQHSMLLHIHGQHLPWTEAALCANYVIA